jgi:hypothetical protein
MVLPAVLMAVAMTVGLSNGNRSQDTGNKHS